jgi:hypothetical protein
MGNHHESRFRNLQRWRQAGSRAATVAIVALSSGASFGQSTPPPTAPSTPPVRPIPVAPMPITPAYTPTFKGFQRPTGFTYQGPRYFSRPFNDGVRFNGDPAYKPPSRPGGGPHRDLQHGVMLPDVNRVGIGSGRGFVSSGDPFSTRYPIAESFHTVVDNSGRIRSFTTTAPLHGYASSYEMTGRNSWDLLRYESDRFRVRAIVNNGLVCSPCRPRAWSNEGFEQVCVAPGVGIGDVLYGQTQTIEEHALSNGAAQTQAAPAGVPLSALEEAIIALDADRPEVATPRLREHLMSNPDDAEVRRLLGLALLMDGELPEGLAEMAGAYAADPGLAASPIDIKAYRIRGAALTEATSRLVGHAKRNGSAVGYFGAAVIHQARGDLASARRMMDLAIKGGLAPELASPMSGALAIPGR